MSSLVSRPFLTAYLVAAAAFMENLDSTVLNTALPTIARDFSVTAASVSIGVSSYLVAVVLSIPISGWLAQRLGPKKVFMSAIGLFLLASFGCALSRSLDIFVGMRIIQGVAGALMLPVGRMMVLEQTSRQQTIKVMATLTWPGLMAPILGPVVGGFICSYWQWPWIFLLNIPIGLVLLVLVGIILDELPLQRRAFDGAGFIWVTSALALLMATIELTAELGSWDLLLLLVAVVMIAGAIYHLYRSPKPLFRLTPFSCREFCIGNRGGTLFRAVIGSVPFVLPLMFQLSMGFSPAKSGSMLLWLFVGNLSMKTRTTWLMETFGFRNVLRINGFLVIVSLLVCAQLSANLPLWLLALLLFLCGMVRSAQFTSLSTLAFIGLPTEQVRDGTTIGSMLRNLSRALGVAFCGLLLAQLPRLPTVGADSAKLFSLVFYILAALAFVAWLDMWRLPRSADDGVKNTPQRTA